MNTIPRNTWRSRMRTLLAMAVVLVIAGDAAAQGARGTVNGMVAGPAGAPIPTVTLILTNLATGVDRRAVNDPTGEFVFGGLQPGTYRLRVDVENTPFAPWAQDQVVLMPGQTLMIRVDLQPSAPAAPAPTQRGTISGTVIGPDGRPQEGVVVIVTAAATGIDRRAVSEPGGAYVFGGLVPGAYRLRVEPADRPPVQLADVMLAPGESRGVDIRIQPLPVPAATELPATRADTATDPGVVAGGQAIIDTRPTGPPEVTAVNAGFEAKPDRWRFDWPDFKRYQGSDGAALPFVDSGGPFDPYNQNRAKGDFPLAGSTFANLNLQFNSNINPRQVAVAAPDQQVFYNQNVVAGLELFGGDTVFEPKRWAIRGTVVANINALDFADPRRKLGVEELFVEKRLGVTSPSFDFVSVRAGMQNFNSDFRGYLFADNQLGVRLFGNARGNRDQFNVAYFSMRNRDQASQLHDFTTRNQDVVIANYYIQDFAAPGYTFMVSATVNRDRGPEADPHELQVFYAGIHGDGRWGAWSVSHAYYEAFGTDDDNAIERTLTGATSAPVDIRARMAAIELSRDADWLRYRFSAMYASGDDAADASVASGFDAITDNPNLAGGQFMFWTQQATKIDGLPGTRLLSEKFTLLPSLRSKFTDRANFVNPGVMLVNGGIDMRVSPQLKVVTNVSMLQFADASVLRALRGSAPGFEDRDIGIDFGLNAKFRPMLNENLFIVPGVSVLLPRGGFATALGSDQMLYSVVVAAQLAF
jgi:hypothetical protein